MRAFCTIITSDHAHYALAAYESFHRFCEVPLEVLCIDRKQVIGQRYVIPKDIHITYLDTLTFDTTGQSIAEKYRDNTDALRWSLKSVWMRYLLIERKYRQVLYIDPDICFFDDPQFLFTSLEEASVLLTPHWRSTDSLADPFNFQLNFRDGIYNGGFIGASIHGVPALEWLAHACLYRCEIDFQNGLFYDQKYMDLLQSRFEGVTVVKHKGCNVANWNQVDCKRELVNGQVLINGIEPVIFVHMTKSTKTGILNEQDGLLKSFLQEYEAILQQIEPSYVPFRVPDVSRKKRKKNIFQRLRKRLVGK